jgi:hypothetical protein
MQYAPRPQAKRWIFDAVFGFVEVRIESQFIQLQLEKIARMVKHRTSTEQAKRVMS